MPLKIERNVPLPDVRTDGITAALRSLRIGDSVFVPGKKAVEMSGFITNAKMRGKLTMRTQSDGVRVWRIK